MSSTSHDVPGLVTVKVPARTSCEAVRFTGSTSTSALDGSLLLWKNEEVQGVRCQGQGSWVAYQISGTGLTQESISTRIDKDIENFGPTIYIGSPTRKLGTLDGVTAFIETANIDFAGVPSKRHLRAVVEDGVLYIAAAEGADNQAASDAAKAALFLDSVNFSDLPSPSK